MDSKKGQGLSMNVIIIAAISLLVLVILAILVTNSSSDFSEGTKCIKKGGTCKTIECPGHYLGDLCTNGFCCSPIPVNS